MLAFRESAELATTLLEQTLGHHDVEPDSPHGTSDRGAVDEAGW
jgi:hypothetical protein